MNALQLRRDVSINCGTVLTEAGTHHRQHGCRAWSSCRVVIPAHQKKLPDRSRHRFIDTQLRGTLRRLLGVHSTVDAHVTFVLGVRHVAAYNFLRDVRQLDC